MLLLQFLDLLMKRSENIVIYFYLFTGTVNCRQVIVGYFICFKIYSIYKQLNGSITDIYS